MAKKNSNLDHFFREKLSGYESPGKKGNWQLMNHLLEAKERKRKFAGRIRLALLFLGIVFSAYVIFIPGSEKDKTLVRNKVNESPSPSTVPAVDSVADKTTAPVAAEKNSDTNTNIVGNMQEPSGKKLFNNTEINNNNNAVAGEKSAGRQEVAVKEKEKHTPSQDSNVNLAAKPEIKFQKENVKANEEKSKESAAASGKKNEDAGEKGVEKPAIATQAEDGAAKTGAPVQDTVINDVETAGNKDSTVNEPAVGGTVTKAVAIPDTVTAETPTKDSLASSVKDSIRARNPRHFSFNLYAGLHLYRTQTRSLADERNVSPLVGLELIRPLSNRFAVGLGTLYSLQGGYNLADTATQVSYFLERNVSQQIILIRKQHKLYVPLTLYYTISDNHAVSCGIHWSYLINTVGDYYETNTVSGNTGQSQEKDVKGYMDGITPSAFSFAVGYRLSLSKRFDINARIIQELEDSYTQEYFYGVNTAPSWMLQTFVSVKF